MAMGLGDWLNKDYANVKGKGLIADGFEALWRTWKMESKTNKEFKVEFHRFREQLFSSEVWPGLAYLQADPPSTQSSTSSRLHQSPSSNQTSSDRPSSNHILSELTSHQHPNHLSNQNTESEGGILHHTFLDRQDGPFINKRKHPSRQPPLPSPISPMLLEIFDSLSKTRMPETCGEVSGGVNRRDWSWVGVLTDSFLEGIREER